MFSFGFSQTGTNASSSLPAPLSDKEKTAIEEDVKAFITTLPKAEEWYDKLLAIEFFALCPNGKRFPVQEFCNEYKKDPTGLVHRTFDDRLVLVIEAVLPGLAQPYWRQAFYLSTGQSSGKGGTWLPFDGIIMKGSPSRQIYNFNIFSKRNRTEEEKTLYFEGWFSKDPFCAPTIGQYILNASFATAEERKEKLLRDTFGGLYLPEGNLLIYKSGFDRYGTLSYLLASHRIGGNEFNYINTSHVFKFLEKTDSVQQLMKIIDQKSPLQECFPKIAAEYPISKIPDVNTYIEQNQALSYMNAFRQEGLIPPGISLANFYFTDLGYELPLEYYVLDILKFVKILWTDYHLGKISKGDVVTSFQNPVAKIKALMEEHRDECILPNESQYKFDISQPMREHYKKYFGGKRRKTRKSKKTKKHKRQTRK